MTLDLHRTLELSMGTRPCRYPTSDGSDHCLHCGWPLDRVPSRGAGETFVIGYRRHRATGRRPHQQGTKLTLSEVGTPSAERGREASLSEDTPSQPQSYPHQYDITPTFGRRGGAGDRLVIPTPAEWTAFRARWAA